MNHVCNMRDPWPVGHPLPEIDDSKLQGPMVGDVVTYTHTKKWGEGYPTVWHEEVEVHTAVVIERSYVWSPGECRHKGGYRHYDWSVIRYGDGPRQVQVVVNDTDLSPYVSKWDDFEPRLSCHDGHPDDSLVT